MGKFVLTSIKNVVEGDNADLHLTITQAIKPFTLKGKILIDNVFSVIDESIVKPVAINKNTRVKSDFRYNETLKYHYIDVSENLSVFEIIIQGNVNADFQSGVVLKVKIPIDNQNFETIDFEVVKHDKPLIINEFKAETYIIQKGPSKLKLSYAVNDAEAELTLFENNEIRHDDLSKQSIVISLDEENKPSGLYEYTFQAKKGNQIVCQKLSIVYVEETKVYKRFTPEDDKVIFNFCAAQNEEYLYTLMHSKIEDTYEIAFTNQINGVNTWSFVKINNQKLIRLFALSPMLHLQTANEKNEGKLGCILFIGGSRLGRPAEGVLLEDIEKPAIVADKVAILYLDKENNNFIQYDPENFSAKYGHTCVLFPKINSSTGVNENTIWLLGGQEEFGNPTNEILTSTDGVTWELETNNPPWSARCLHSATVSWIYKDGIRKKEALWLAGGFKDFAAVGDKLQKDIWRFKNNKWEEIKVQNEDIINDDSHAFAIAYGGPDTGILVFGNPGIKSEDSYSLLLNKNISGNLEFRTATPIEIKHFSQGCYITAFFRECMWVMGVHDDSAEGIYFSKLRYRIPTIDGETIKVYDKNKMLIS